MPTAAGVVLPITVLAVEAGRATRGGRADAAAVVAVGGFGLLGLVDDVVGDRGGVGGSRGFGGHLAALGTGSVTTGGLKLLGGGAVALAAVAAACTSSGQVTRPRLLADASLVALSANLANLFDRAPGRTVKVGALAFALLAAGTGARLRGGGAAVASGAALALLADDLRERLMLGDTGANALGAGLGLGVVTSASSSARTAALVAVAALNLVSERVSFSRVIEAAPPLRALDRLGRLPSAPS